MKEKIFETILDKPVKIIYKNINKALKEGYFNKWGKLKYHWNKKKDKLLIEDEIWSAEIVFLKKKLIVYAGIPALAKPFVIPIIKKEIEKALSQIIS